MLQFVMCVFATLFAVAKADDKLISKGSWRFIAMGECEDADNYEMTFNVSKYKISRLEDAFNAYCNLPNGLDNSYSLHADVQKYTEGGWKDFQVIKDDCFLCFLDKHAHGNLYHLKEEMGLDGNQEDIPKGEYSVSRYIFNYCDLPPDGIVGTFRAKALALDTLSLPKGCVMLTMEFREELDDCGEEEE